MAATLLQTDVAIVNAWLFPGKWTAIAMNRNQLLKNQYICISKCNRSGRFSNRRKKITWT